MEQKKLQTPSLRKASKSLENLSDKFSDMDFLTRSLELFHSENQSILYSDKRRLSLSDNSIDICFIYDSDTSKNSTSLQEDTSKTSTSCQDVTFGKEEVRYSLRDSGIDEGQDLFGGLERKIDKLGEMLINQNQILASLQAEMNSSNEMIEDIMKTYVNQLADAVHSTLWKRLTLPEDPEVREQSKTAGDAAVGAVRNGAEALLGALEAQRQTAIIDESIKSTLTNFLQSDELRESLVSATMSGLKSVIEQCFEEDVTSAFLPMLGRSHRTMTRQLLRTLEDGFRDKSTMSGLKSVIEQCFEEDVTSAFLPMLGRSHRTMTRQLLRTLEDGFRDKLDRHTNQLARLKSWRVMRAAVERHQRVLEVSVARMRDHTLFATVHNTFSRILRTELKQWRSKILCGGGEDQVSDVMSVVPLSPPQPAEQGKTAIELLMNAAEINSSIQNGDVNGTFSRALSAGDLSLVMSACRAVTPDAVFTPCRLQQEVLLSLVQQLATDMVHETQLKCRYLEDTLMNLDPQHPVTARHLTAVLTEVTGNLSNFLHKYPSHVCHRRIKILVMAAGSLMSQRPGNTETKEYINYTEPQSHSKSVKIGAKRKIRIQKIYDF